MHCFYTRTRLSVCLTQSKSKHNFYLHALFSCLGCTVYYCDVVILIVSGYLKIECVRYTTSMDSYTCILVNFPQRLIDETMSITHTNNVCVCVCVFTRQLCYNVGMCLVDYVFAKYHNTYTAKSGYLYCKMNQYLIHTQKSENQKVCVCAVCS